MEELPKHPDVARIFTQLLDTLGMNAAQFARKIGSTPQAVSNYMVGRNEPGRKMLALIIEAYPNIDAGWLATGVGEPFPNGKFLQLPAPVPSEARAAGVVVEEPRLTYATAPVEPALAVRLMEELADCQKQNRLDLARAQKDFREDLNASGRTWQYTVDRMKETSDGQAAEIVRLRAENGELRAYAGLDLPSVREVPAAPALAPAPVPTSAPIGFGRPQPHGAEMHAVPGGLYDASFHRLPTAEAEPCPLRLAA